MLRTVGGRPGLRRLLVSYFRAASLRCQASSVAGVTGKTSAQRLRGMNRVSAANQARSAGSYRTRPAFRRSTAFWCRSTSNSAFFSPSPRTTRTARLNNQRISRQAILSSTRSANHHHASPAGEAGRSTTRSSFRAAQDQVPRSTVRITRHQPPPRPPAPASLRLSIHALCPYQAWIWQAGPAVLVEDSKPWIAMAVTCSHAH